VEHSPEERARVDSLIDELLAAIWTAMKSGETAGMNPPQLSRLNLDYALLVLNPTDPPTRPGALWRQR
jgi:hypothetical protein